MSTSLVAEARELRDAATPGPWHVEELLEYGEPVDYYLLISRWRESAFLNTVNFGQDRDTAALVAAAPRLLAGLADRVEELESNGAEDHELAGRYIDLGVVLNEAGVARYEDAGGDAVEADVDTRVGWLVDDWREAEARVAELEAGIERYVAVQPEPAQELVRRALLDGGTDTEPHRCPTHGIPDCSPLLNGCSWRPADTEPSRPCAYPIDDCRCLLPRGHAGPHGCKHIGPTEEADDGR